MTDKARILKLIDVTQERLRKGSNAAGCFEVLRDEIERLFENKNKGANEMTTEQQDLAWACLPKEDREVFRKTYATNCATRIDCCRERAFILDWVFGHHNLTSDTEPSEFICVERVKVDALQSEIFKEIMDAHDAEDWQSVAHYVLDVLPRSFHAIFGDKCLPDKDISKTEATEHVSDAELKFKVGDKVVAINEGKITYDGVIIDDLIMANSPQLESETKGNKDNMNMKEKPSN